MLRWLEGGCPLTRSVHAYSIHTVGGGIGQWLMLPEYVGEYGRCGRYLFLTPPKNNLIELRAVEET